MGTHIPVKVGVIWKRKVRKSTLKSISLLINNQGVTHTHQVYCFVHIYGAFIYGSISAIINYMTMTIFHVDRMTEHYLKEFCHRINEHANILFLFFC